jgi:hypothetical protein
MNMFRKKLAEQGIIERLRNSGGPTEKLLL